MEINYRLDSLPQEKHPEDWNEKRAYLITYLHSDGINTDGIDYVVLDDDNIAYRYTGDYRKTSEWKITDVDVLIHLINSDIENLILSNLKKFIQ